MAISEELKKIYATAPVASYYIETLSLAHPIFPNGIRYLTNHSGSPDTELAGYVGNLEGGGQAAFEFVPFVVIPPAEFVWRTNVSIEPAQIAKRSHR